jgi:hypothetical protein
MLYSNPTLIKKKEELLSGDFDSLKSYKHNESILFDFHGIELKFLSKNKKLITDLKEYLPSEWIRSNSKSFTSIYHFEFPHSSIEWEDEESSDVFGSAKEIGIQRDFAAIKKSEKECLVYFNNTIDDGLHNFMRWFLSPPLLQKSKAILHSSALVENRKKAFLFLGPSGAGKTTITSLGQNRLVLSDDMNLIDFKNGCSVFPGGVGGLYKPQVSIAQGFPIETAYWIIQSDEHAVKQVSKKTQLRYLLTSFANLPWQSVDKESSESILQSAQEILDHLEIKELYFKKDADFWEIL